MAQLGIDEWDDTPRGYAVTLHQPNQVHHTVGLGDGAVVWPFTTILAGSQLGRYVTIGTCVFIGRRVTIGAETRIHPGAAIPDGAVIGSRCYIGSNVTLTDVRRPDLADKASEVHLPPVIEDDCVIGCNAVILPGVRIGKGATVGAGSVVTRDVRPGTTVAGNPSRVLASSRRLRVPQLNEAAEVVG